MIRKYQNADLNQVMELWRISNIEAHNFVTREFWENNYEYVKSALPKATIYVYEIEKEIIGFIGLEGEYIEGIFVKKENQSQGIGKELIDEAKRFKTRLTLRVYEKNIRAIEFYKKQGFEIGKKFKNLTTNEIEYEMSWLKNKGDD